MSEYRVCRLLPYAQHLVRLAVCDVLEQEGCLDFVREGAGGAVLAHITVYGNPGRFSIAVRDGPAGTELAVSITEPRPGLSPEGRRRAENYLADRVEQLLEEERSIPWYGQLMNTPQTIAYMLQVNHWMETYRVELV